MRKRVLAMFLSIMMLFSMLPTWAVAEEPDNLAIVEEAENFELEETLDEAWYPRKERI